MWTKRIVPMEKQFQFALHCLAAERNNESACTTIFHRQDHTLDERNAAMLSNRTVAQLDPSPTTPPLKAITEEHAILVSDEITGPPQLANRPTK